MVKNLVEDNWRLTSSVELPPCDGPKLQAFKHRSACIHWGDYIGGIGDESEDIWSQAYVFRVEIKTGTYALKVFKFSKPSTRRFVLGPIWGKSLNGDELAFDTNPFFAECRSYRRVEEAWIKEKRIRKVSRERDRINTP